jgi:hypothetical protein
VVSIGVIRQVVRVLARFFFDVYVWIHGMWDSELEATLF